jgi:heme-degrading monooxygenase HmoA
MQVRAVTFTGATNIDEGVAFVRDQVLPILVSQKGYRGMTTSADRADGVIGIITLWETVEDLDASDGALAQSRVDGANIVGGTVSVDNYEQVVLEVVSPLAVGSALSVSPMSMSPEKVDENIDYFKSSSLPDMLATPGVLSIRNMVNRETGNAIVGVVWANHDALAAGAGAAASRRAAAAERGIEFDDVSIREVLLMDLR